MIKDYICVDIENPNSKANSICSIGIVVVKNNIVVERIYSLINPEDSFDAINSKITNLCSADVKNAPTFQSFWDTHKELFYDEIIVGHNVTYDLSVISKTLLNYGIKLPEFKYFCTYKLSRSFLITESYKLDNLCKKYNLPIEQHHNSLEDAKAAQKLFEFLCNNFDIGVPQDYFYEEKAKKAAEKTLKVNINILHGIIQGINYDNTINDEEVYILKKWITDNDDYRQHPTIQYLISKMERILEDNYISEYEKIELIELISNTGYSSKYSEATLSLQKLYGIIDGIMADKIIEDKEIFNLRSWLDDNDYLSDIYPYDKIVLEITDILEDGIISSNEKNKLLNTFSEVINPSKQKVSAIDFTGKTFCLTGEFLSGSKKEIADKLKQKGAIEKTSVSSKLDYLIVGLVGSDSWKFGNYGGKVLKAKEFQEKGSTIKIIDENDLNEVCL